MKSLYIIILLIWIAPGLLLFFYLAWKNQLLSRCVGLLKSRIAERKPNLPE